MYCLADGGYAWRLTACLPSDAIARPAEWDGTGLPPVGTKCEVHIHNNVWRECTVIAHFEGRAVVILGNREAVHLRNAEQLRPIRTPEQIAYEQEQAAIAPVLHIMKGVWGFITPDMGSDEKRLEAIARQLYRDGYIKAGEGGHVQP